jgi:hypothetical protein
MSNVEIKRNRNLDTTRATFRDREKICDMLTSKATVLLCEPTLVEPVDLTRQGEKFGLARRAGHRRGFCVCLVAKCGRSAMVGTPRENEPTEAT